MTETHAPIRTALIGFGLSGRVFHSPLLAADDQFSLDVIVTSDTERAAEAARRHPDAQIVSTPAEAFRQAENLDLVVIATPPDTHVELAGEAITCGLHGVVDKPFAVSSPEAGALIDRAAAAGVVLTVFQNRRWDGDFITLSKIVDDGELGEVHTFESRFERWSPVSRTPWKEQTGAAGGGGILFDLGTHVIDQALQLFGPVEDIHAETSRHSSTSASDADDDTFVSLLHSNGVRSRLWMNRFAGQVGSRFRVLGSEAAYTKWGLDGQEAALAAGTLPTDGDYGKDNIWGMLGRDGDTRPYEAERGDYPAFYSQLGRAILDGGSVPVDPEGPLEVLRIIEKIHGLY
ncbi:Gfo/Idh/MocA family protein [Arthrobacter castelli]|uniref:Gfo/Idh/MocA family protein n=1 Tax=Arthrobacter castelli TaxID=271431 RepID=UPI0003FB8402|nr:Gfo/Idh/MocA family oxidoreductase [Arthrobacter castelli]